MNANVHTSIGLATASGIALLAPIMNGHDKITLGLGFGCAIVGALIPDIDANGDSKAKIEFRKVMSLLSIFGIVTVGYALTTGRLQEIASSFFHSMHGVGALLFLIACIIGYNTPHRTFTHWLIGLVCFTVPFILMTNITLGIWFGIGMLSHQVIDMLNKKKITWLFPLPIDFARYICKASSRLSTIIGSIATVLACIFIILLIK